MLEKAKKIGTPGRSVFNAIAGQGRHGVLHEQHFFELTGQMTMVMEFTVDAVAAAELLDIVDEDGAPLCRVKFPAKFGLLNIDEVSRYRRRSLLLSRSSIVRVQPENAPCRDHLFLLGTGPVSCRVRSGNRAGRGTPGRVPDRLHPP